MLDSYFSDVQKIVPPLEHCKKIPAGEFTKTVFIWEETLDCSDCRIGLNTPNVNEVSAFQGLNIYPAPTLEEILNDIWEYTQANFTTDYIVDGTTLYKFPTECTEALKTWFCVLKKQKKS